MYMYMYIHVHVHIHNVHVHIHNVHVHVLHTTKYSTKCINDVIIFISLIEKKFNK